MTRLLIEKEDYDILKSILQKYPYKFYAYGSRVKGTAEKYSDLDLCYQDNIEGYKVEEIRELLEKSDLSFIVELVN
jgi:predicted nucleotidyltransferase